VSCASSNGGSVRWVVCSSGTPRTKPDKNARDSRLARTGPADDAERLPAAHHHINAIDRANRTRPAGHHGRPSEALAETARFEERPSSPSARRTLAPVRVAAELVEGSTPWQAGHSHRLGPEMTSDATPWCDLQRWSVAHAPLPAVAEEASELPP
jgi:hypothetical protein